MKINEQKKNIIKRSSTKLVSLKVDMKDCHEGIEKCDYEKLVNRKLVMESGLPWLSFRNESSWEMYLCLDKDSENGGGGLSWEYWNCN